jgi:branched-chain amino acid transport system ATP-binding protein
MADLLEVDRLSKKFGAIVVADMVTFSVARGTCLGMIGPNGAGKSSLFNLIAGTEVPDGGSVRLDAHDLLGTSPHLRAQLGIGRAFQMPQPFPHLTVYENVLAAAYFGGGLRSVEAESWAMEMLARARLTDKATRLAGGLSLLDRKWLEFAKAMASRPKLLLLDEIAAGLTEPEVEELVASILSVKDEHAIVWIEHIPNALRAAADRILVLHFGRKVLEGSPADVMTSKIVREIYMGLTEDDIA